MQIWFRIVSENVSRIFAALQYATGGLRQACSPQPWVSQYVSILAWGAMYCTLMLWILSRRRPI